MSKSYSMNQLIENGIVIAEDDDTFFITNPDNDIVIEYGEAEVVDGFTVEDGLVEFCTPCGMEHVNEFSVGVDAEEFKLYRKVPVEL